MAYDRRLMMINYNDGEWLMMVNKGLLLYSGE